MLAAVLLVHGRAAGDESAGWIPSLAIGADVQTGTASATVASSLRGEFDGGRSFVSGNPTLRGELMSPVIGEVPGRPRLFAHAGWQWGWTVLDEERFVVKELNPSQVVIEPSPFPAVADTPPKLVDGQGSEVDLEIRNGWYTGLGIAFHVPLAGFDFLLKPSADYYQQSLRYQGTVLNVTCQVIINLNKPRCVKGTQAIQDIGRSDDSTLHALGPRLGVELEVGQRGPLSFALFAEGFVYWIVGDRSVRFEGQSGGDTATFSAKTDSLMGGGSVGMRMSWRGQ